MKFETSWLHVFNVSFCAVQPLFLPKRSILYCPASNPLLLWSFFALLWVIWVFNESHSNGGYTGMKVGFGIHRLELKSLEYRRYWFILLYIIQKLISIRSINIYRKIEISKFLRRGSISRRIYYFRSQKMLNNLYRTWQIWYVTSSKRTEKSKNNLCMYIMY